jgi:prepilin-type N-terminal cleavage/methylation domain-containing protein
MNRTIQRARRRGDRLRGDAGFTMVELMVGILIFALVATAVAAGMSSSLNLTRQNKNRSIAANLASQEMDTVRSMKFTDLEAQVGHTEYAQTVDNVPYTVNRDTEWTYPSATSGPCQAPSGSALAYLEVNVYVQWPNMAGVPAPTSETVITPPVGTYNKTTGHIAVLVLDAAGAPQEDVTVTLSPGSEPAQVTPADGCAFFAFQTVGSYTVTLNTTGFVNDQGVTSPSQTVSVVAGTKSSLTFQYDQASTLNLTMAGSSGGIVPANLPISLGHTQLAPNGRKVFTGTTNPRTITGLFPYVAGYETWAGNCLDSDPEGINPSTSAAYYPGASRDAPIGVVAGSTSSGTVTMGTIQVQARTAAMAARPGISITFSAAHAAEAGGCAAATYTATGTTDASGNLLVALPYGTWTVRLTSPTTTATQSKTLSPLTGMQTVMFQW